LSPSDDFELDLPEHHGRPDADPLAEVEIRPDPDPPEPATPPSLFSSSSPELTAEHAAPPAAAPLFARLTAGATDAAMCAVPAVLALLSAGAAARTAPDSIGWLWTAAFAALLSFFLTVATLVLFGKTPGMAVAELTCRTAEGAQPDLAAAVRRWAVSAATVLLAGLPLLSVLLDAGRRTPADLLSGCPLRPDPTGQIR